MINPLKNCISLSLAMYFVLAILPVSAFAADNINTNGAGGVAGVNVTVLDSATPATHSGGYDWPISVWYFTTADGTRLGYISGTDAFAIIERNGNITPQEGWDNWFVHAFNTFRGLNENSGVTTDSDMIERYRQEMIRLVNVERKNVGLHPYIVNQICMDYSQMRAGELSTKFSHTRPDGTHAGYEVISVGRANPEDVVRAWMNSPGHRAALLNRNRTLVGAGFYAHNGIHHWQMFFDLGPDEHSNAFVNP